MHTVLYHRADLDGHCSGAIAALSLRQRQLDFKLHGIDYGDPIPWDLIDGHDLIVLDWSFQPWELFSEVLRRAKSLVWIDHHKTAIETWRQGVEPVPSAPQVAVLDTSHAACELTWQYYHGTPRTQRASMPECVRLLGRYDVWDHSDPRVLPFQYRMRLHETDPAKHEPEQLFWTHLLCERPDLAPMIQEGTLLMQYQERQDSRAVAGAWFPLDFAGLRWQACNRTGLGSQFFQSVWDREKYHGMLAFGWTHGHWKVGLYSDRTDVDCGALAQQHGGGGHKGAAGFTTATLPFHLPPNMTADRSERIFS